MVIGIDLGTTNTVVAYIDKSGQPQIIENREGERVTPSVVMFEEDVILVGRIAKNNSILDPKNVIQFIKKQIGNKDYKFKSEEGQEFTAEEISAIILKRIKEDAEKVIGEKVSKAVITVPTDFDEVKKMATKNAGEIAGLEILKVINEPTAAALAYKMKNEDKEENVIIYDLGGGTFDVSVVNIESEEISVKATGGNKNLGGLDFDNMVIKYLGDKFNEKHNVNIYENPIALQELREKAEWTKKVLSTRKKVSVPIIALGKAFKIEVTREILEDLIKGLLNKTLIILDEVVEESNLLESQINKVLFVGGSTRIKCVEELVKNKTGIAPSKELNPEEIIAIGAAYEGYIIENAKKDKIVDVISYSLGIKAIDKDNKEFNCIILDKNTKIPVEKSREFYIPGKNQKNICVEITQGDSEKIEEVKIISKIELKLNKSLNKNEPVKIKISYNENFIINISIVDKKNKEEIGKIEINKSLNLKKETIEKMKKNLLNLNID